MDYVWNLNRTISLLSPVPMQGASKHNKQTEHMQNSVYLRSIIASRTCVQDAVIRIPYIIKQMCIKVLYNTTLSHHMCR